MCIRDRGREARSEKHLQVGRLLGRGRAALFLEAEEDACGESDEDQQGDPDLPLPCAVLENADYSKENRERAERKRDQHWLDRELGELKRIRGENLNEKERLPEDEGDENDPHRSPPAVPGGDRHAHAERADAAANTVPGEERPDKQKDGGPKKNPSPHRDFVETHSFPFSPLPVSYT